MLASHACTVSVWRHTVVRFVFAWMLVVIKSFTSHFHFSIGPTQQQRHSSFSSSPIDLPHHIHQFGFILTFQNKSFLVALPSKHSVFIVCCISFVFHCLFAFFFFFGKNLLIEPIFECFSAHQRYTSSNIFVLPSIILVFICHFHFPIALHCALHPCVNSSSFCRLARTLFTHC